MTSSDFTKCLETRKLVRSEGAKKLSASELRESERDLTDAEESLTAGKVKWATVQAYYSVFHALRALLYTKGYRERSHGCTLVGVEELYVRQQKVLKREDIEMAEMMMRLREDADYSAAYSEEGAQTAVENAKLFLKKARGVLRAK